MTTTDKNFSGSIPAIYERLMVPMLFEPYARVIAKRLTALDPRDVLEIAAGTGVLTRALVAGLGAPVRIVATDLNQPMLDMAMERQDTDSGVTWTQADGLALPFEDQSFDALACQFGVMFFPDKIKGYREALRVLRPGGHYIFSVWDKLEGNDFVTTVNHALIERFPTDPPRFMERTPHGYWNLDAIRDEVIAAGFSTVETETVDDVSNAASALAAATAYCQGSPLRAEIEARAPGELVAVTTKVAEALEEQFGHGPIQGKIRAFIVTATR